MNKEELQEILDKHSKWLNGEDGGNRANLSNADLSYAYLYRANLSYAYLSNANLSYAYLSYADLSYAYLSNANLSNADLSYAYLSYAYLSNADLSYAYLSNANLSYADLSNADLSNADLSNTCLDPELVSLQREFCKACPPLATGGRIVFRTAKSQHVGNTEYVPGHTYTAPVFSFDCATDCHAGIYAASLKWMQDNYKHELLVVCYVRDGDWVISAKGAIRCKKLRVLRYYEEKEG